MYYGMEYLFLMTNQYNKDTLFPEDFTEVDKENYESYFEQSKVLFPKLANEDWVLRMGILAYMRKKKWQC